MTEPTTSSPTTAAGPDVEDLRQYFYLCPVGLAETDAAGRVRMVNPEAVRLLAPMMDEVDVSDLAPVVARLAPGHLEAMASPAPPGRIGSERLVTCTDRERDTWISVEIVRIDDDRFMVVVVDVTGEERLRRREARAALEVNDSVVQTLVAAETAIDLGRHDVGRRLLGEASRASRDWIGRQLGASGARRDGAATTRRAAPVGASAQDGGHRG